VFDSIVEKRLGLAPAGAGVANVHDGCLAFLSVCASINGDLIDAFDWCVYEEKCLATREACCYRTCYSKWLVLVLFTQHRDHSLAICCLAFIALSDRLRIACFCMKTFTCFRAVPACDCANSRISCAWVVIGGFH
jgi:hypothetical protein